MRVIIGGCGRVGSMLATRLVAEGHEVAVIDRSPDALKGLGRGFKGRIIRGLVFDQGALYKAGIEDCDAFIAVTSGDNSNVVAATVAKNIYKVPRVMARIFDPRRAEIYRRLGIPTVSSVTWAANEIVSLVMHPSLSREVSLGSGEVSLVRIAVGPELVDTPFADLHVAGEIVPIAIVRSGRAFIPADGERFAAGDTLEAAVASTGMAHLQSLTHAQSPARLVTVPAADVEKRPDTPPRESVGEMYALIVGGGKVGSELAMMLGRAGIGMSVIEKGEERCDAIEPRLNELGIGVYCGDGDEPGLLEEAGIRRADVVVAATGDDEDNLVVCLLAKNEYAVSLTLARVNNPQNAWLFTEAFGVDVPVSQTTMIAELLRKHVPGKA